MSDMKAYALMENDSPESTEVFLAKTRKQAMYMYKGSTGSDWRDIRAYRKPWLDDYEDVVAPDAIMAQLRHGWSVPLDDFKDGLFDDSLANLDGMVNPSDFYQYAKDHHMTYEDVCKLYAQHIGATYPDKYKSMDEVV